MTWAVVVWAFVTLMFSPISSFQVGAEADTGAPPVELLSGQDDPAAKAISRLRDGDGLLLFTPGLRYYSTLAGSEAALRILHVTPGKEPLGEVQFEGWKKSVPVRPDSASLRDGKITARFGRNEVTVVALNAVIVPASRCAVVLDPDFFLPLYENEVRGGIIDLSMKLFRSMVEAGAAGFPLYVIDPLSTPYFPLQWSYVGSLWIDIWQHPDAFRGDLPAKWKTRKESEFLAEFGQFEEATVLLEDARPHFPKDGSIEFQLARLAFRDRETAEGIRHMNRAVKTDRRFLRGYSEYGNYFSSKERPDVAEMVLRAGLLQDKADRSLNLQLFKLLLERAETVANLDPDGARKNLEDALGLSVPQETRERALMLRKKLPPSP